MTSHIINSISSPLPIIRTEIPIAGFFWVAPLILLSLYLYFHIYLQRLWETLTDLPAAFPDKSRLDKRAYPWLLNGLVTSHFKRLRISRPQFSRLQTGLSILFEADLRYADLRKANLQNSNLNFTNFIGAQLEDVILKGAKLHGLYLEGYYFVRDNLQGIDLSGADLQNIEFVGANLQDTNFEGAHFDKNNFEDFGLPDDLQARVKKKNFSIMNLSGTYLLDVDLRNFDFHESNLHKARFSQVDLREVDFSHTNLRNADMQGNLGGVNLSRADLRQADIRYSNLSQANLHQANLKGTLLVQVDLRHANLSQANLSGLTFGNWVKIEGAYFKGADFSGSHIRNARGLTCKQLQETVIDDKTRLPDYLDSCQQ